MYRSPWKFFRNQILLVYSGRWRNQSCQIFFQSVHPGVSGKGSNFAIFSANRRWPLQLLYYRTTVIHIQKSDIMLAEWMWIHSIKIGFVFRLHYRNISHHAAVQFSSVADPPRQNPRREIESNNFGQRTWARRTQGGVLCPLLFRVLRSFYCVYSQCLIGSLAQGQNNYQPTEVGRRQIKDPALYKVQEVQGNSCKQDSSIDYAIND